ncbi:MAG: hypothetical protein NC922_05180 [Candidatus Omnitrophica bacterium]|nr:hypothetical protein [Candidatus Omnitrophota bacterium]
MKRCYPIKVKEIYPGIIIGEDRIITCRSGKFTLGNDKSLIVYIYEGPDGLLKKEYKIEGDKKTGITIADIELNDNQIAVIVEN